MKTSSLQWLRCPFCGGRFELPVRDRHAVELEYGFLHCYCGRYPVVAGIPLLKKGVFGMRDRDTTWSTEEVIAAIQAGRFNDALLYLLTPPPPNAAELAPAWTQKLPPVKGSGRLKTRLGRRAFAQWRERVSGLLANPRTSPRDIFSLYYPGEQNNYFGLRYGQPRHLAALAFANLIDRPKKPVLDLACGFGHITRSLARQVGSQVVVGLDRNFFMLYAAKKWLAPQAEYICGNADAGLPFATGTFSFAFCSDAFQLFLHKVTCIQELKRLTRDEGTILLIAVRNALVNKELYPDYRSLPPDAYEELVADLPHRLVANSDVVDRYLCKQKPALRCSATRERLEQEQWLSVVASYREDIFQDHGTFADWPHAEGHLVLNPLFTEESHDEGGNVYLRREFPSTWYEREDGECKSYQPEHVTIDAKLLDDLAGGKRTPEIESLIKQCVIVGMPEYAFPGKNSQSLL